MELAIIVARAKNGVIGIDNTLPWSLPEDLKHFKQTTVGHPIIMGRKTWDSLGRALPGRRNIVISRQSEYSPVGAESFHSLEEAIQSCAHVEKAFIIGGAQIYEQALALDSLNKLIITEVDVEINGDAFFPTISLTQWKEVERIEHPANLHSEKPTPAYAFVTYTRI